jgi:hypothetical protein
MGRRPKEEPAANYNCSILPSNEERKRMRKILNGQDAIDSSKIIKQKTTKSNDKNFFIPEKWNY